MKKHLIAVSAMLAALSPTAAFAQVAGADPQGSGPIVAALGWLQGTLLGHVATTVAVIAVAMVGFMMLTGRLNWRFGATVIVGCFVLFGSAAIVAGIQSTAGMAG
ncbi:TrbC/VirB2 family protein [Sphingomonas carotinifaciens]|uniref:Type IV secretion system protein VirB2 n=1 Tax=Sphingomonas carotinifaciens TaxID=1166323 RepID=A0A1G7M1J8_9SPHN|nr:TrbC/VirB2 family protein [Sphingomonas carotinifaciens]MBB4086952.1 type IV secretion system protein VirB2 [Sphingomonas carotinifaciens]MWC42146.1 type VI secretion protein [Sphingomonas carotinifaciens]SDF55675.1 type IV secretion system protein VirB2 [Sphingomonas carotinifaciens]